MAANADPPDDAAFARSHDASSAALTDSLRTLFATFFALARNRLALLALDAVEAKQLFSRLVFLALISIFLAALGLIFLAAFFTVLFWESHRALVLGSFAGCFLVGAAWSGWCLYRLNRACALLFSATRAEFGKDRAFFTREPI